MWNKIMIFLVLTILATIAVEARGGARGGGGRSGGSRAGGSRGGSSYRGGNTMNRTPSMSRTSIPTSRTSMQSKATAQARRDMRTTTTPARMQHAQKPTAANRADLRNQVNQYAQSRPTQNFDRQNLSQQSFSSQRAQQINQGRINSQRVSQNLRQTRPGYNQLFDRNFFDRHDIDVDYVGAGNLWRPAAWASLATWGNWNWSTPYYYNEGYTYPITTTESLYTTPTTSEPVATQNTQISDDDWLPLGVFAVASNANLAAQSNRFLQLAINRNGEIAGVLYNSVTDFAQDLTGTVDAKTQMAYWSLANKTDSPIASTGVYNLTEDETTMNVHFSDGSNQTWTLVRLQQ